METIPSKRVKTRSPKKKKLIRELIYLASPVVFALIVMSLIQIGSLCATESIRNFAVIEKQYVNKTYTTEIYNVTDRTFNNVRAVFRVSTSGGTFYFEVPVGEDAVAPHEAVTIQFSFDMVESMAIERGMQLFSSNVHFEKIVWDR
ncbi:MAG: hypothetical protein FWF10_05865 [Clostridiales bacterium]|nr:hypothetical protein [Clostridiales bacterium]